MQAGSPVHEEKLMRGYDITGTKEEEPRQDEKSSVGQKPGPQLIKLIT